MEQDDISYIEEHDVRTRSDHVRLGLAVLLGAALGIGVYFLALKNGSAQAAPQAPNAGNPAALCVCPKCGTAVNKPAGGPDCEELTCPNCGTPMMDGVTLAAARGNAVNTGAAGGMTQNRQETLAEQGIVPIGPPNQNVQETLAEQGMVPIGPQPVAMAQPAPMNAEGNCICPNCGKTIERIAGMACANMQCPFCRNPMTNAIFVGRPAEQRLAEQRLDPREPRNMLLAAMGQAAPGPLANMAPYAQAGAAAMSPCPGVCPGIPAQVAMGNAAVVGSAPLGITYENTVKGIIAKNCLSCHGGAIRNLTTFENVKVYANNGLLTMLTQPGGPMSHFLTVHEYHQLTQWVAAGAPR